MIVLPGIGRGVAGRAEKRSRAKRWGRLLDLQTWPEVLRRYCLATRAGLPMSEAQLRGVDVADMTADEIAVYAALCLGRTGWWTLSAPLHTRLLSTLCDDISLGACLRSEITARCEEASQLHVRRPRDGCIPVGRPAVHHYGILSLHSPHALGSKSFQIS